MKPLARYAALSNYVELGHSLGLDPARLVREAGLDPAGLSLQDRWVPAAAITELLERSAAESGHEDFGLRLAELRRFSSLGPLSLIIREEPDLRSGLGMMARHEHAYNEALRIRIVERNGIATVRLALDTGHPGGIRQSIEFAVGVLHGIVRAFLGPTWRPVETAFTHTAPQDRATHHRLFGPTVKFGRDYNGIALYTTDLDRPNTGSDPQLRSYTQRLLTELGAHRDATTADRVRELVELLLPTGRCSIEQVARSLGVDRRTVHRRLAAEGETFTSILDATRAELARHVVANRHHTLTEVADMLGFSTPGNFTRWFRNHYGCSPTQWRRTQPS
ncbi:AraC family transcriptional regulator [Nocardia sp. alder85J]|uniref:AraC family transcriptional regulator n=1 Tax=Nocardia sp. alder85J TaxID=2862949 RepID=UPI001CD558A7|nr:AraC family transcriptional regulator [Nocardia sp. alder85J]MCX4095187.1 AraC family transcriptional regulator [Nocardia sp. alder85J]